MFDFMYILTYHVLDKIENILITLTIRKIFPLLFFQKQLLQILVHGSEKEHQYQRL